MADPIQDEEEQGKKKWFLLLLFLLVAAGIAYLLSQDEGGSADPQRQQEQKQDDSSGQYLGNKKTIYGNLQKKPTIKKDKLDKISETIKNLPGKIKDLYKPDTRKLTKQEKDCFDKVGLLINKDSFKTIIFDYEERIEVPQDSKIYNGIYKGYLLFRSAKYRYDLSLMAGLKLLSYEEGYSRGIYDIYIHKNNKRLTSGRKSDLYSVVIGENKNNFTMNIPLDLLPTEIGDTFVKLLKSNKNDQSIYAIGKGSYVELHKGEASGIIKLGCIQDDCEEIGLWCFKKIKNEEEYIKNNSFE